MARSLLLFLAAAPLLALSLLGEPMVQTVLHNPVWLAAVFRTLLIAEISVPVALLLAVPAAIGVHGAPHTLRRFLTVLCVLPVVLPPYWVAMGLRDEAGRAGFHGAHLAALIAAHAGPAAAVAFVVMLKAFDACDWPARDTALAQGAGQFRALWLGAWHAPSDGLAVSAAASFAVAVGLTIPDILTPASHPTLAVLLTAAREAASTYAAPAGLLLAILSLAGVAVAFSLRLLRAWR